MLRAGAARALCGLGRIASSLERGRGDLRVACYRVKEVKKTSHKHSGPKQ